MHNIKYTAEIWILLGTGWVMNDPKYVGYGDGGKVTDWERFLNCSEMWDQLFVTGIQSGAYQEGGWEYS